MGKQIKRKLASIVLAVAMLVTLLPTGVMADYYDNGDLSMSVDHQYDYDSYDTYYAYTNHSFDCSFYGNYYRDDTVEFKVYLDNEDITSKYGVESNDSSLISISIPQDVISKYDVDSTHTITYGFYNENGESDCKEEKTITVKKPHFKYSRKWSGSGDEYLVGSEVLWASSLANLGSCEKYDWDNPTGSYTDEVVATSYEVINDTSTPNAFVAEELFGDDISIKANKPGHAIVKIYYPKLDGYEDDNPDGYYSLDFTAKDEMVNFNITSDLKDTSTVVPGTEFNLKANAESNLLTDNGGFVRQESERNITYKWYVNQNESQGVTVTTDENDSSVCHVKVANDASAIEPAVYLTYSYIDSEGNVQSNSDNPLSYCFTIEDSYYTLECEGLPETLAVGDKVVITPVLKKISSGNKEEAVKDADIYCSWQDGSIDVVPIADGKFEITRNSDDYASFCLKSDSYYGTYEERYSFDTLLNQNIKFVDSDLYYDGVNDVKLCLNMADVTAQYDNVSLYTYTYNDVGDEQRTLINSSEYFCRKFEDVIYYILPVKWVEKIISKEGHFYIDAVVSNKGNKIATAVANISYNTKPFSVYISNNLVNCSGSMSGSTIYYFDNKGYNCVLDSLKEDGNNLMKISRNNGYWQYRAIKAGSTKVNAYYHYYRNGKRVDDVTTTTLDIKDSYTSLLLETDSGQYQFAGCTYYYEIRCQQISYDKNGNQQTKDIDNSYSYKCSFKPEIVFNHGNNIDLDVSVDDNSRVRLEVKENSGEGNGRLYVTGYDSEGNEIGCSYTYIEVRNKPDYIANVNTVNYEANGKKTVMPFVKEYSKDNPDGKDVSSDYYVTVTPEKEGVTDITKNEDGSVTLCKKSAKKNILNDITFTWTPKVSENRDEFTITLFDYSGEDDDDVNSGSDANQVIDVKQSVTLIDNNTLGLNIYWTAKDSLCLSDAVKYSVEGEPYNTWYQTLESSDVSDDDGLNHYTTTLKLGAAQLAKNIKVQLVMRPGYGDDVIKEFTTSVASYTKKLLDSTDASYAKYKPLLKSMLNYGAAAQSYFGYDTKTPANSCLADKDKTIGDIPKRDIDRFNINKKFHIKGLTYYGTSLVLGDKVTMRHYFKLEEGRDISNYIAYMYEYYGNEYKFQKKGDLYYIETTDSFKSIFERSMIYISDGNNSEYFMYSPMNYVAKAYIKGNMKPELKKLINSMYWMETEKNKLA